MLDYKELKKLWNNSNVSVKHYVNGKTAVTDSVNFKGMAMSALETMQDYSLGI